jgi:transketolase
MQQISKPFFGRGDEPLDRLAIDTIRMLAIDAVQNANSGHPGTALALAPVAYTLWARFLNYDPATPDWPNRDRFVMSNGHASMLLYSLLHLSGVEELDAAGRKTGNKAVSIDDIRSFRQLDSKTPGHPEYRMTTGVETTTGPLGQGCGNSVGMAIAERWLGAHYNRDGFPVFDHNVYAFCGDGDMMEGVSGESASLAGHLKLANLCWIYDNNSITIEGHTSLAFSEDVATRFKGYGWRTVVVDDANDVNAFADAVEQFKATDDRPTIILVRSVIGYGSPKADSEKAHGSPLGVDAVKATKLAYGWPVDKQFYVPEGIPEHLSNSMTDRSRALRQHWETMLKGYGERYPDLAAELRTMLAGELPADWAKGIPSFMADTKGVATRDSGGKVENAIGAAVPWLVGGSADLAPSTKTLFAFDNAGSFQTGSYGGRNLHFGVREHAMGSVVNGMTLSYLRGFSATFLVFSDYMRPPIRLASLMRLPIVFVFTHDSIGVGEDGPTHQPVEQLAALRAMPGVDVIRPGDANEVAEAWKLAITAKDRPTCLVFSRQALPTLDRSKYAPAAGVAKGAYVLTEDDSGGQPDIILIATGSELSIATDAAEVLLQEGCRPRVVSMPSSDIFERQDQAYRDKVLPPNVSARVAIEQASEFGWDRYVGRDGRTVTMTTFGASAPIKKLQERFGFTVDNIIAVCRSVMAATR